MDRHLLTLALGMFAIGTDSFVVAGILPLIAHSMNAPIPAYSDDRDQRFR